MECVTVPFAAKDRAGRILHLDAMISQHFAGDCLYHIYISPVHIRGTSLYADALLHNSSFTISIVSLISSVHRRGHGTMMLNSLLNAVEYLEMHTGCVCKVISGYLSRSDKVDGNWKDSLPFYENFPRYNTSSRYEVSCLFRDKKSGKEYTAYQQFMEHSNEGCIEFYLTPRRTL